MWSKFPCVIQWVLVIYFINSIVHILVWSYSFLHGPIFISWWLEISKSVRQCLQVRNSFLCIFRFHLGVTSYDTCLSLSALIHLEWSSLLSFPWLNMALFPTSFLLRNIVLCMYPIVCIHSSVLLQVILFTVLAVVYTGAKIAGWPISFKILVVFT